MGAFVGSSGVAAGGALATTAEVAAVGCTEAIIDGSTWAAGGVTARGAAGPAATGDGALAADSGVAAEAEAGSGWTGVVLPVLTGALAAAMISGFVSGRLCT